MRTFNVRTKDAFESLGFRFSSDEFENCWICDEISKSQKSNGDHYYKYLDYEIVIKYMIMSKQYHFQVFKFGREKSNGFADNHRDAILKAFEGIRESSKETLKETFIRKSKYSFINRV